MIAQTDSLSGGAGWAGAGLLGLVLFWLLFKHLPAKDAQLKEFVAGKDAAITGVVGTFTAEAKEQRAVYWQALDKIAAEARAERLSCEKNFETIAAALRSRK